MKSSARVSCPIEGRESSGATGVARLILLRRPSPGPYAAQGGVTDGNLLCGGAARRAGETRASSAGRAARGRRIHRHLGRRRPPPHAVGGAYRATSRRDDRGPGRRARRRRGAHHPRGTNAPYRLPLRRCGRSRRAGRLHPGRIRVGGRSRPAQAHPGAPRGPLAGLTFAAKDLFDVAGHPTGGGNPDWARQHPVPTRHAWAVQRLLDAGATLIGKTVTDEVSLGILGENPFDGTPLNPKAPDRVPGGSSSGSASAVAQGLCDVALGTDTGGSVRVPASFCGLYGIRPTHGRLDLTGMMPQAPSSDTTGWFARDAETFARVSSVMLGESIPATLPLRLLIAVDAFGLAEPETTAALQPMVKKLSMLVREVREDLLAPPGLSVWSRAQRTLQPYEGWLTFKAWLARDNTRMQVNVARWLAVASA